VITLDNTPVLYSSGLSQTLNDFVTVALTSLANNIYTITVKVNGNNPFGRTITILTQYAFNFKITAVSGATFPTSQSIQPLSSTQSATINGSAFTGYTFSQTGVLTAYTYNQSAISSWTIFQPVGQVQWVITPSNTGNEIDTYVFTIDLNRSVPAATTGITYTASGVYDNSFITLAGTSTSQSFVRNTGTGTLTTTLTPTTTLLTTTRSGGNQTNLSITNVAATSVVSTTFTGALTGAASRVGNTLQSSGTQYLTMLPLSASTASQVVGTNASLNYNVTSGVLTSPTVSAIISSSNINILYNSAVTASSGIVYVPNVFTSTFTDYEISVSLGAPNTNALGFDFITGSNTRLALGWDTLTSYVNGTANATLTPPSSLCYLTVLPAIGNTMKHRCVVSNPTGGLLNKQFIAGPNIGYLTGGASPTQTTYTTTGINTTTTPSQTGFAIIISGGGSWTGNIVVRGCNY